MVVLGGGPAGLSLGIALSRRGRSVAVLERTRYDRPRAGETFGGELGPLLKSLGAWDGFAALAPVAFRGVHSAWGGADLAERASIFHPFGDGWHVDRARFDAFLAQCAAQAGVAVEQGVGRCAITWSDGAWKVRGASGHELTARFLVDASGRGAPAGAVMLAERRWMRADRLVALLGTMSSTSPLEPVLLLEAVEEGWWYSVPQPGGALLAALMTDADLLPARGRAGLVEHFTHALGRTVHTAARAAPATLLAPPWIARADSGLLLPDRGPGWRAVGDAALACDPLAGDGVVRSMRSALEAAAEIDAELSGSAAADSRSLHARFRDYLEVRGRYYAREARWPGSTFWLRRRPPFDWKAAEIFLDPQKILQWDGKPPPCEVEALLPPPAVRAVLERLRTPRPAHQALALLQKTAPLDDRRLLVGLQLLVDRGCLSLCD